jgi:hypothetical protein
MTQSRLDRLVARTTGEPLHLVRSLGFHLLDGRASELEPEELSLGTNCPFCGHRVLLLSGPGGLPAVAECRRCDVEFDCRPEEVYAAGPPKALAVA